MAAKPTSTESPSDESPAAASSTPEPPPRQEHRFFTWMRSLGIVRQPGWLGGVSVGIADRLGIDPLIVRGIIVVIAVLGGPALLLYAAAWLLLPDHTNKIHLEQLIRGNFEAPIAGIGAMVLLSMLPLTQGFWFLGSSFWGAPFWDVSIGRVFWTLVVLAAVVAFVLWVARRSSRSDPTVTPATTDDRPDTIPQPVRDGAAGSATATDAAASVVTQGASAVVAEPAAAPPAAPVAPTDASTDELAAWREQQALWKKQNAEWKAQQAATQRQVRDQRAAEARDRALASAAEAAERRRLHRLANPRISAAVGWMVIGAAIVGGAIGSAVASGMPGLVGYEVTVGLAVAAIVFGVAIVTAGALRRRSGILSFLAVLVILATLLSAMLPRDRVLVGAYASIGAGEDARYSQAAGSLSITVDELSSPGVTDIWQGAGNLHITVFEGAAARIEMMQRAGSAMLWEYVPLGNDVVGYEGSNVVGSGLGPGGEWRRSVLVGDENADHVVTVRIWQGAGSIEIQDQNQPVVEEVTE